MEKTNEEPKGVTTKVEMRSIGQLFRDSWGIFSKGWVQFLKFALIAAGIGIGLFLLYLVIAVALGIGTSFNFSEAEGLTVNWPIIIALILVGIVLMVIVGTIFALSMNKLVYNVGENNNEGIKPSIKYGWKNFPSFLLVEIMLGLTLIVGYILLIVPGVILTIFLSLVTPVFVLEGKRGLEVFKRSWALVKGNFGDVFIRLFLLFFISLILSSFQYTTNDPSVSSFISLVLIVPQFILSFFSVAYSYHIYKDLAKTK